MIGRINGGLIVALVNIDILLSQGLLFRGEAVAGSKGRGDCCACVCELGCDVAHL